jgi:hypothetical protein
VGNDPWLAIFKGPADFISLYRLFCPISRRLYGQA